MNAKKKRTGFAAVRENKQNAKMSEYYRNERGTLIKIVAQCRDYLWIETQLEDGARDRGRIKTTDKFRLVNEGTWKPVNQDV